MLVLYILSEFLLRTSSRRKGAHIDKVAASSLLPYAVMLGVCSSVVPLFALFPQISIHPLATTLRNQYKRPKGKYDILTCQNAFSYLGDATMSRFEYSLGYYRAAAVYSLYMMFVLNMDRDAVTINI